MFLKCFILANTGILFCFVWHHKIPPERHPLFSKYGFRKNKMATTKTETQGFKTSVNKPVSDVTTATSFIYTVYGSNNKYKYSRNLKINKKCLL